MWLFKIRFGTPSSMAVVKPIRKISAEYKVNFHIESLRAGKCSIMLNENQKILGIFDCLKPKKLKIFKEPIDKN